MMDDEVLWLECIQCDELIMMMFAFVHSPVSSASPLMLITKKRLKSIFSIENALRQYKEQRYAIALNFFLGMKKLFRTYSFRGMCYLPNKIVALATTKTTLLHGAPTS